ncbi:hypothetical protein A5893_04885 [Pedobacter psychrophilus]|uniref:Glycoside hydrolase family 5 domain-containing protein n=1 Tax=Pedobacter psychrophilus TaxID=1826909 RepID=A0A179DGY4_9SPHI|nr:hypothetical protein [Pedobacter psychrophilus]OAQ40291.1 hypothetical protein A5893_04885 [Pedobacter psychrophilus]
MKIILISILIIFYSDFTIAQQNVKSKNESLATTISPYLFGQNAWEKNEIFKVIDDIKAVHYQTIRIGGNGYENGGFMNKEVIKLIDYARSVGAEPIVQMPRQLKNDDKAFKAISYLNGELHKNIKFWSIGNEPDHHNQLSSPEEVYDYFIKIAAQIKRYDPKATIMGFDLASYKLKYLTRLLGGDLDVTKKVPNQDYYYLDIVSFHNYKFKDITGFEKNVKDLNQLLNPINSKREESEKIGWAITEFNSHWIVDKSLGEDFLPYSFYNGQIFAEMYDLGMREGAFTICPWSILEGGADREGTDLGMFDLIGGKYFPRSNYYHTQMLTQNFRSIYLSHQNKSEITVIPMGDKLGVSVMIINKNKSNGFKYKLQLNLDKDKNNQDVIAIDANLKTVLKIDIQPASTQMFIFNNKGKLIKKYTYSSKDEEMKNPPKIETF